jgi:copper transport protein
MRVLGRRLHLWLCAAFVVTGFMNARPAAAHGLLIGASPAPNSVLAVAPTRIELRFNEDINGRLSRVVLVQGSVRTPLRLLRADGRTLTYDAAALEPGAYIVEWRVISSIDGHLTRGAFAFGVGADAVPAGVVDTAGRTWPDIGIRWLGLIGALTALGTAFGFGWLPVSPGTESRLALRAARLVTGAAALVVLSSLARVWLDAAAVADSDGGPAGMIRALGQVLGASPTGHDALFRITGALFLARLLRRRDESTRAPAAVIGAVLLIGPTLTSHGLTKGLGGALLSFAHLAAASVWVGGLIYFGLIYLPTVRGESAEFVRGAAARFSRLALVCVLVLAVTGGAQAWLYAGAPTAFGRSTYGRTLIAKLAVIAPLLLLAAVNRWRILPRLTAATTMAGALAVTVRAEAALTQIVLLLAAAIAVSAPATTAGLAPPGAGGPTVAGGVSGDVAMTLTIDPALPGPGRMTITVADVPGNVRPATASSTAARYRVRVVSLDRDLPPRLVPVEVVAGRPETLAAQGLIFDQAGWWAVEIRVRRAGREDVSLWLPAFIEGPGAESKPTKDAGDPRAVRLLRRTEIETARVRSWEEIEHLSDGERSWATTWYAFVRPDHVMYRTSVGSEGRQIGFASYSRDAGGAWTRTRRDSAVRIEFRFPLAEGMADAQVGARFDDEGRAVQIITYQEPSGQLRFAAWIDETAGLPRRMMMHGPGHTMVSSIQRYNEPISITTPLPGR